MHLTEQLLEFLLTPKRAEIARVTRTISRLDASDTQNTLKWMVLELYLGSLEGYVAGFYAEFRSCVTFNGEPEALRQFEARYAPTFSVFSRAIH
ncbi:MAG: hypothetical protein ABL904_21210 [Hyphomicrobiaceae bacterium]